ncbi:ISAzo13-like element transposase-related protein, partial [Acaryochloris marina NIES-2412]
MEDLRLASSILLGAKRRSFQAEMALKYCGGSARCTERVFGWGRNNVALGLEEKRTGMTCIGAQA